MDSTNPYESPTSEALPYPEAAATKFHWYFSVISPISEVVFVFGVILFALGAPITFSNAAAFVWLSLTSGALGCGLLSCKSRYKFASAVLLILILHNPITELLR